MRRDWVIGVLLLAWAAPYWIFPTLYTVHAYYRWESAVFLILVVAACLSWLPAWAGTLLALLLVVLQMLTFQRVYAPMLGEDHGMVVMAKFIQAHTKPDDVLVVYGMEWTPELCYYAQRRCVMETTLQNLSDVIRRGGDIDDAGSARASNGPRTNQPTPSNRNHRSVLWNAAAGRPYASVGAIIRCPCPKWDGNPQYEALFRGWGLTGVTCKVAFLDKPPAVSAR